MHFDLGLVEPEVPGKPAAQREWRLVRGPYFDSIIVTDLDGARLRLDVAVKTQWRAKRVLEDTGSIFEPGVKIAVCPLTVGLHVGQLGFTLRGVLISGRIVVQQRRARANRFDRIGDIRQFLVLHIDQIQCLLGDLVIVCGDGCNRLANVAHAVLGQKRHIFHAQTDHDCRYIGTGDNAADAWQLCCHGCINPDNARMG